MITDSKRITKNTFMLYTRMILITLVSLYTSRIILNVLGVEDYGIYNAVGGIVFMLGFLISAMSSATQRYISFELGVGDVKQLTKVFSTSMTIHIIISIVVVVIAETAGLWFLNYKMVIPAERLVAANWTYQFSILTFIVTILSVPYNAIIISYERMNIFAYISIIEVVLKLGLVYFLLIVENDKLQIYSILMFLSALIIRILYQIYCHKNFPASRYKFNWDNKLIKEMLSYASWSLFGGIAYVAKSQGVNIVLNLFFGVFINAAYAISQQIGNAVLSMITNFNIALNPPIVKSYAKGEIDTTYKLLFAGMRYSFVLTACIIFPLLINTEVVIGMWLGQIPDYTIIFTQLTLIVLLLESIIQPIASYIQATGRIKIYQSVVGTLLFLILPFSYIGLKFSNNPNLVFYITIIVTIVSIIARFIITYKSLKFTKGDLFFVLKTMFIISIGNVILYFLTINLESGLLMLLSTTIASIILTVSLFAIFCMKKNEREKILNMIKRKIKR